MKSKDIQKWIKYAVKEGKRKKLAIKQPPITLNVSWAAFKIVAARYFGLLNYLCDLTLGIATTISK